MSRYLLTRIKIGIKPLYGRLGNGHSLRKKCNMISETNLVVQSNPLVEAQYKLSEAEQKLLRIIISMIQPDTLGLEKKFYRFSVQDFANFLGRSLSHHDIHQQMRRMAQNLKNSNVTVTLPNGDTIKASWIAGFKYPKNKGWIEFEISWMLEEQLLRVKEQFTKYYLSNISKLKGEYSVRIYELVQQYANSNMRSRTMDLEELKLSLGVNYPAGNLFRRVITPSHKEICAKTDISFSFQPIKESRKIVAVEFYDIQKKTAIPPSILSLIPEKYRENQDVLKNIEKYLNLQGPEYVTEKLQYVASRKDVTHYPDYLNSVLQNNHGEDFKPTPETSKVIDFPSGKIFEFGGKRYTFNGNGLRI
jgi:plasmid replication initiation protein